MAISTERIDGTDRPERIGEHLVTITDTKVGWAWRWNVGDVHHEIEFVNANGAWLRGVRVEPGAMSQRRMVGVPYPAGAEHARRIATALIEGRLPPVQ